MHARLRGPNNLFILDEIKIEPDVPCLADEIAEPHPDMNIKVAAFTVSEKSLNIFPPKIIFSQCNENLQSVNLVNYG